MTPDALPHLNERQYQLAAHILADATVTHITNYKARCIITERVSRETVRRDLHALVAAGLLRQCGRGTFYRVIR